MDAHFCTENKGSITDMNSVLRLAFLLIASAGGVGFTDLQQPVNTVMHAVRTTFKLAGTVINKGSTASTAKARCDAGMRKAAGPLD